MKHDNKLPDSLVRAAQEILHPKKNLEQINEEVCEVDFDGEMARSNLFKLAKYSQELLGMIDDDSDLEPWVQSKITLASDYIGSVKHYLEYQHTKKPRMY